MTSSSKFLCQFFCQKIWTFQIYPLAKFDKGMSRFFFLSYAKLSAQRRLNPQCVSVSWNARCYFFTDFVESLYCYCQNGGKTTKILEGAYGQTKSPDISL